jgi:hypothetical protein
LLAGLALLAIAAYVFHGLAHGGKVWWQQEWSRMAHTGRSAKASSSGKDAVLSPASTKVYGVLAQQDEAASGDDGAGAPSSGSPSVLDHVNATDSGASNHFLHRRFPVETCQIFTFEVPARAIHPELRGTFRAVAAGRNPDGAASVELLLFNEDEFSRFVSNRPVPTEFRLNPSGRGAIHWGLKANLDSPQKYYLVFRNASEGQGPSIVDADFTLSPE